MSEETAVINVEYSVAEIEPSHVQAMMTRIAEMRAVVQKNLVEGHDYGKIQGCPKPSLWKPGAEKILILFGLASEYEIIDKVQDYEKGFFAFTVRCFLSRNGIPVTQGVGHCNTKERKYQKSNPYDLANTVLKMAKKRAQVDATLTVASLSDIFTQDLEDLQDIDKEPQPKPEPRKPEPRKPEPRKPEPRKPEPRKPTLMDEFNALKQRYVTVTGNVPHAENAMKKVAVAGNHSKITREYLDALVEDILVREHAKTDSVAE